VDQNTDELELDLNPFDRFADAFARSQAQARPSIDDPTAMSLATADAAGRPSVRIVLLHGFDARGFTFYTNYDGRKGEELDVNPHAALCFYWPWLDEQIRAEGTVSRISAAESDAYFASRPRGKQVGAWASRQSRPLASRAALIAQVEEVERRFADAPVPRPPHWGGYRLAPERVEFWKAGEFRLHDRFLYVRDGDGWRAQRLYP
jgi:pyridoxamine 5'-phosphate oxidase